MVTTESILETLDNKLDEVDELIMQLPLQESVKKKLTSKVYELWMDVEEEIELRATDFG
jgi:leucyl aminopeptidase